MFNELKWSNFFSIKKLIIQMFSFASRLENGEANIDLGQTTWHNLRQKSSRLSKTLQVGYQLELGFLGLNQFNILKTT